MAFRSAAHMNDDTDNLTWTIEGGEGMYHALSFFHLIHEDLAVYQQVLITAFRFTPVVLEHHVPCKILPDGRVYVTLLQQCVPLLTSVQQTTIANDEI